jgi:N-formylglutamate deformylase
MTRGRPDFILGDRYGTSCAPELTDLSAQILTRRGYSVTRNKPYAGGFITEHYGNPAAGLHALQLEINRALYMDERRYARSANFARLAADLETVACRLGEIPLDDLRPFRAAAAE